MKKVCGFVLMLALAVGVVLAADSIVYTQAHVFISESILAGTNAVSQTYEMNEYKPAGYFSLQMNVASGTVAYVAVEISNNDTDWVAAEVLIQGVYTNRMFEAFSLTSGPASDGVGIVSFGPQVCKALRLRCYATSDAVVTAAMVIQ